MKFAKDILQMINLKNGYIGSSDTDELFQYFGAKPRDLHNALEDCRIAADVLRKIAL